MSRIARAVVPGLPHHVTQRGNRRQPTFFCEDDYRRYLALLREWCERFAVEIWSYCLMPNHVHLIAVPPTTGALRLALGEAHRRYTRATNEREGWRGHLWQGRFASFVMDARHTLAAARYIELNPVRAGLVADAAEYEWSSAQAHLAGHEGGLVRMQPLLDAAGDWAAFLGSSAGGGEAELFHLHETTGRPLGDDLFVRAVEIVLDRDLHGKPAGRPRGAASLRP